MASDAATVQRNTDHPPEMAAQCDMGPGPNRMLIRRFPASYNDQMIVYKETWGTPGISNTPERFNLRNYRQSDNSYKFTADADQTPFPTLRFCWPRGGTEFGLLMEQALQGGSVNAGTATAAAAAAEAAATPIFDAQVTTGERFYQMDTLMRNTDHFNHEENYCHPEPGPSRRLFFRNPELYDGRVFIYNIKPRALARQEVFDMRNLLKSPDHWSYYKFEGDTTYTHEEDVRFCWVRGGMTYAEGRAFEEFARADIAAGRRPNPPGTGTATRVVPTPVAPPPTIRADEAPVERYYLFLNPRTGRKVKGILLREKDRLFFIMRNEVPFYIELASETPLRAFPSDLDPETLMFEKKILWRALNQAPRTEENHHRFLPRLGAICAARPGPLPDEVFANLDRFDRQLWVYTVDPKQGEIFKNENIIPPQPAAGGWAVWSYEFDGDLNERTRRLVTTPKMDLRFCYLQDADALDLADCPICMEKVSIRYCSPGCGNRHSEVFHFKCLVGLPIKQHGRRECPLDNAPFDGVRFGYRTPSLAAVGGAGSGASAAAGGSSGGSTTASTIGGTSTTEGGRRHHRNRKSIRRQKQQKQQKQQKRRSTRK